MDVVGFCLGVLLSACLLLAAVSPCHAGALGVLKCVVHDGQHRPVPGATLTIRARQGGWTNSAVSGAEGEIELTDVPVGEYAVDVTLSGFTTAHLVATVRPDAAAVLHVQMEVAGVTEALTVTEHPSGGARASIAPPTMVNRRDISGTPGAGRTNSLSMVTAFVPGSYVTHDQLHVRGGHRVTWLVDGVPVPNTNIASNVGPQFDPKDADALEIHRGGYDAQHGDDSFAVVNVVPPTGFERDNDVEVVASAGSYWQTNDQVSTGGHTERFAYYGSASGNRSDLGLQPTAVEVLHDRQDGLAALGTLLFNPNARNQLRLVASARRDRYQVPNDPAAQAAGVDDRERESDAFVNMSWLRSFASGALLTVSPFYHRNRARFDGGVADALVVAADHRTSSYLGGQATLEAATGRHEWQVGIYGFSQHDEHAIALAFNDDSRPGIEVREHPSGRLWSLFAQDTFRMTSWLSVTGGVRRTRFSGGVRDDATTPGAGVAITIPSIGWVLRGFYGRFYQAPPLMTASGRVLELVTSQNLALIPLHGERDEDVQAGLAVPFRGWTIDADAFRTRATNFFDHNSIGNSNVFFPLTIDGARIRGAEVTLRSPRLWKAAQAHVAYSYQIAEGFGAVSGGLTDFSPPAGTFPLDHDQRHTLSAGVDGHLAHGVSAAANVYFGSGFPNDGGPARLPGHTTLDLTAGRNLGKMLSLSVTALNVTNLRVLIDDSPTFGGRHFNEPREIYVELKYRFRY